MKILFSVTISAAATPLESDIIFVTEPFLYLIFVWQCHKLMFSFPFICRMPTKLPQRTFAMQWRYQIFAVNLIYITLQTILSILATVERSFRLQAEAKNTSIFELRTVSGQSQHKPRCHYKSIVTLHLLTRQEPCLSK